jgi:pyruvate/2-oxoglutarate dehydrogenase complex dihydrolipoamide acyltransferase (E2) component
MSNATVNRFPSSRVASLDVLQLGRQKHHVAGLLEIDVTEAREKIKAYRKRTRNPLSFTTWLVWVLAQTLERHPYAHAYLKGKRNRVIFEDVDLTVTIERQSGNERVPYPCLIRRCNHKSLQDIEGEIKNAQTEPVKENKSVLGRNDSSGWIRLYSVMPGVLRRLFWRIILRHPKIAQNMMGSAVLTSVGMIGRIDGWFLHTSIHPLSVGVGSILKKPAVKGDTIQIRKMVKMTVLLDHDVIDGAPMARFIQELSKNIESACGLES